MKTVITWYVFGKNMVSTFNSFADAVDTLEMLIGNNIEFSVSYKY